MSSTKEIITSFFVALGAMTFARAEELLKADYTFGSAIPWSDLHSALLLLANCERSYYSMSYLEPKQLRKNALSNSYLHVLEDLKRIVNRFDVSTPGNQHLAPSPAASPATSPAVGFRGSGRRLTGAGLANAPPWTVDPPFFRALFHQTLVLVQLRVNLVNFYRSLVSLSGMPHYEGLLDATQQFGSSYCSVFKHPLLEKLAGHVISEITLLQTLLSMQVALSRMNFRDSFFLMQKARLTLEAWRAALLANDFPKGSPGLYDLNGGLVQGGAGTSAVFHWLQLLFTNLVAKSSLYFRTFLKRAEDDFSEGRIPMGKSDTDYVTRIETFLSKSDMGAVCLIFDSQGKGFFHGYTCPNPTQEDDTEPVTGLRSWPAIYSNPASPPLAHWPNIISMIMDNQAYLDACKDPLVFHEKAFECTYYLTKVDPRVTLVVLSKVDGGGDDDHHHQTKKKKNSSSADKSVIEFLNTVSVGLRHGFVFTKLAKPNTRPLR